MRLVGLVLVLMLAGCATVQLPDGGPKDVTPPRADSSTALPGFGATEVGNGQVYIEFDEFIRLNNPANQILISPRPEESPEFKLKGKSVSFNIGDLAPNTTFSVLFGNGIQDITENNPATGLQMVFSTGTYIDSASITGTLLDAYTGSPLADHAIMLYTSNVDSLPETTKPSYATSTNASGSFRFNYLKPGDYKIFALKDGNQNYLFDLPVEAIAFSDTMVRSDVPAPTILLRSFTERPKERFPKMRISSEGRASLYGVEFFQPTVEGEHMIPNTLSQGKDTMNFFLQYPLPDSGMVILKDMGFSDTITFYPPPEIKRKEPIIGILNAPKYIESDVPLTLTFSDLINSVDTAKIRVIKDSTELPVQIDFYADTLKLDFETEPKALYRIQIDASACVGRSELTHPDLELMVRSRKEDHYATMNLHIQPDASITGPFIAILSDATGATLDILQFDADFKRSYEALHPGKYTLRLIADVNANRYWDPGDYQAGIQPESVYHYTEVIELRSNWKVDIHWEPELSKP